MWPAPNSFSMLTLIAPLFNQGGKVSVFPSSGCVVQEHWSSIDFLYLDEKAWTLPLLLPKYVLSFLTFPLK